MVQLSASVDDGRRAERFIPLIGLKAKGLSGCQTTEELSAMDVEKELAALAAEQQAYAMVLESVLAKMVHDRTMRHTITDAFNQAEDVADDVAVEFAGAPGIPDQHKVRGIIKKIRKVVLGDETKPRGLV
jgi:hypothetical protein